MQYQFHEIFSTIESLLKKTLNQLCIGKAVILVMIGGYISAISTMCPIIGKNLKNLTAQKEFSIEFTHNIPRVQSNLQVRFSN